MCSIFTHWYTNRSCLQDVVKLTDKLLEVCNKKVEVQRLPALLTMDKVCQSLGRLTNIRYVAQLFTMYVYTYIAIPVVIMSLFTVQ